MRELNDIECIINKLLDETGEIRLPKRLEEKLATMNKIDNWLCSEGKTERDVVDMLMMEPWQMPQSTAYLLIKETKKVFTIVTVDDKKYLLKQAFEKNQEYQQLALQRQDFKALAAFEKNRIDMIKAIPEAPVIPNFEVIKSNVFIFSFNPAAIGIEPLEKDRLLELYKEFTTPKGGQQSHDVLKIIAADGHSED